MITDDTHKLSAAPQTGSVTSRRAKLVIAGARLIVAQRFHYILVHGDYIRGFSLAHAHRMGRANVSAVMRVEFCNTRNVDFTDRLLRIRCRLLNLITFTNIVLL